jgi:hypothetical protein
MPLSITPAADRPKALIFSFCIHPFNNGGRWPTEKTQKIQTEENTITSAKYLNKLRTEHPTNESTNTNFRWNFGGVLLRTVGTRRPMLASRSHGSFRCHECSNFGSPALQSLPAPIFIPDKGDEWPSRPLSFLFFLNKDRA